jgi:predicted O-methyltransferase YrrM
MMQREECEKLADLAQGAVVLEVGACLGCSTIALASTAEHVVSVDWHRGDTQTIGWGGPPRQYASFSGFQYLDNLMRYGVLEKVSAVVADCNSIGPLLADASFDFAFIDGDHRYDAVCRNIEMFLPKVKPGGVIAFHDYGLHVLNADPSTRCYEKQAVDERWGEPDEVVGMLAVINV